MATSSSMSLETSDASHLAFAGTRKQQQGATLSSEYCEEMSTTDCINSGAEETAMMLDLQERNDKLGMREGAVESELLVGEGSAAVAIEANAVTAAENKQEGERQDTSREQLFSHGREQVLLWSVRKGLAPIVAAAVDGFGRGEALLETPSSAATAPMKKEAATLEDETPRTSAPSSEVSPTNNFCSYKTFPSSSAASTNPASFSESWCTASTSQTGGNTEADDIDNRCFVPAAVQPSAEIVAAAAAATVSEAISSSGVPPVAGAAPSTKDSAAFTDAAGETAQGLSGDSVAAEITRCMSADTAGVMASDTSEAAAASGMQMTATSADAAAVLCSPAALSLLATPCPVGGAAAGRPICAADAQASPGSDAAAEGIAIDKGSVKTAVGTAGITRTADAAVVATMNVDAVTGEDVEAVLAADNEKNVYLTQYENADLQGAFLKNVPQELLETLTRCPLQEKERVGEHLLEAGSSEAAAYGAAAAESFSREKGGWDASFAEVGDARQLPLALAGENLTKTINSGAAGEDERAELAKKDGIRVPAGRAAGSEQADFSATGNHSAPSRGRTSRNAEHRGGSLLLWDCRSQLSGAVEEDVAAAAALCSSTQNTVKVLSQENEGERQQQPCRMATGDSPSSLQSTNAGLAPLSATSCCSEFSGSPFAAALKGDISPVSCCSSSTASVTSPTSSPLSSASCSTLVCVAGGTGTASAAANEAAAPREGIAGVETTLARDQTVVQSDSSADCEGKNEDANGVSLPDVKTADTSSSSAATRDNNAPTWYVGFRLPLGAEGRQVLLRRLRRAYHAAPPTTRDAVLASHGLYFSRVPFATVSDLFKLSHLLGVFDFAVQCSHEFGGSGAAGSSVSAGGGGGSHAGKRNHNHGRNANKNGNSSQKQLCSSTGAAAGEEGKSIASTAEGDPVTLATGIAPTHLGAAMTPTAGGRKSSAVVPRAGAAAAGHYGEVARKGGNGEPMEQTPSAESSSIVCSASKERAASVEGDFGEVRMTPFAAGMRGGATGRGEALAKSDEMELQASSKAATGAPRNRVPQQKRSAAGRSSVCRTAARQQQAEQQQQHNLLKETESLRSVDAAGRSGGVDRNMHNRSFDWQTQQHILLQQLLQAGLAEPQAGAAGGTDGKSAFEAEALALLNGEFEKAAAGGPANALLPPFAKTGCCATKDNQQQQQHLDEQLLLLQLQEHAKTAAASCRRGSFKTLDTLLESRNVRVEQQSQCFLSDAQQSRPRGGPQQQYQQQQATAEWDNVNGGRVGAKRSCQSADTLLQQHEQRQWCSWPSSTCAADEENKNTWDRQVPEGLTKAQLPSPADLLPFLASAAEQLRNSGSYVPSAVAGAARPSYRGSRKSEGKTVFAAALKNDCSGSGSSSTNSSFLDWNGFLMENYLSTAREQPQQQQQQGQPDAMLFAASGSSTSASTHANLIRVAAPPVPASAPRQPEPRLQEEEIVRLTKRARTTTTTITTTTRPPGSEVPVSPGNQITGAGVSTGICAGLLGKEASLQEYTPEEEALLSALLVAVGSPACDQQQQQRRWTANTVEEITRLLLQLNHGNSSNGTEEEFRGQGDLLRRPSHHQAKENSAHGDGGSCKHSSSVDIPSQCGRASFSGISSCGNIVSNCGSISKDGFSLGFRASVSKSSSPTSVCVSPAENACTSSSLVVSASADAGSTTAQRRGSEVASYEFALQPEARGMPTHELQERFSMLPFLQGNSVSAAGQQQPQQDPARRLLTSRGSSGGRNSYSSSTADSAAAGGCSRNRGQIDSSSSREGHTDVFLQLTSQLQLLSAQVMQQHESQEGQQHREHSAVEQQYRHHLPTQQACGALQKLGSGPSAAAGITAGIQEEPGTVVSGRLCSAEKASEYAAGVQLLQLVELLQVQHRVSRLLSLFPKAPPSAASPSTLTSSVAAAAASPSSVSAAPLRPAGPPAPAAGATVVASDSAAAAADAPSATEPFASLLAALASSILEGKANIANQATESPPSTLLGLGLGKTDVTTLLKSGGNSGPVQEPMEVYSVQQEQQQRVPLPNRSPGSRGSTTKSSNNKRTANRSGINKGNSTKTSSSKGSNRQGGDRKFSSAMETELVDDQPAAAAGGGSVSAGRGIGAREPCTALPKQQEAIVSNCVSHSNSFSTCCSDDVADLCTSRGSSSSGNKSSHDSSVDLDGMCSAQPTYDRRYAHESYSCSQSRENIADICM